LLEVGSSTRDSVINIIVTLTVLAIISPFLWALAIRKIQPEATAKLWIDNRYKGPILMLQIFRWVLALLLITYFINAFLSFYYALAVLGIVMLLILFNYKRLQWVYEKIEERFMANYMDRETAEHQKKRTDLAPWDAHITTMTIPSDYKDIGQSLFKLQLRE